MKRGQMSKNLQIPERRAFSIRETERATNLSHATIYRLIAIEELQKRAAIETGITIQSHCRPVN